MFVITPFLLNIIQKMYPEFNNIVPQKKKVQMDDTLWNEITLKAMAMMLVTLVQLIINPDAMKFLMKFFYYREEQLEWNRIYLSPKSNKPFEFCVHSAFSTSCFLKMRKPYFYEPPWDKSIYYFNLHKVKER